MRTGQKEDTNLTLNVQFVIFKDVKMRGRFLLPQHFNTLTDRLRNESWRNDISASWRQRDYYSHEHQALGIRVALGRDGIRSGLGATVHLDAGRI